MMPKTTVAIHEAGHAALHIALGLGLKEVTIVTDCTSQGSSTHRGTGDHGDTDDSAATLHMIAEEAFWLRHAIAYYAGAEAVRQLLPAVTDPGEGAEVDQLFAGDAVNSITDDAESIDLLFALAKRRCSILVEHYRPEIAAISTALHAYKTLSGEAARKVFMESIVKRDGRLLAF